MNSWNRRQFARNVLATSAALGLPSSAIAAEPQTKDETDAPSRSTSAGADPYRFVNPELVAAIKALPNIPLTLAVLAQVRNIPLLPPLPPPMPQPQNRMIPGTPGSPDVHIVIVDPSPGGRNRPVLVHMHGGGYVAANTSLYPFIQKLAHDCQCVVISVDYRLAPETHFPGSLDDNYAALRWVHANAGTLGIDSTRIAVGGESAGGGHAAALAIRARDRAEVPIIFQLLLYPMLDDRTGSTRSVPPSMGQFIWTPEKNQFGWTALLGVPAGSAQVTPAEAPARVASVAGLSPAWIGVGSIDLFCDEDIDYARRLMDGGVSTHLNVFPGAYHAFDLLAPNAAVSKRFTESWTSALRRAFATT